MGNDAARPIFAALLLGVSMLITVVVVAKVDSAWKYLIVLLPISMLAGTVYLIVDTARTPDPARR
jgi:1,4-dihydroxy-2-naphthoate octaprenyltransferase